MKIITCCKVVPNEELIKVLPSRELSFDNVPNKISAYDLNALEAGKRLAKETKGQVVALTVGNEATLKNSKIQKDILSRGMNELNIVANDNHKYIDSLETAKAIAKSIEEIKEFDLVLFGTGSSDLYTQAVGTQVGALLNLPVLSNVINIVVNGDVLEVQRAVGSSVETFEVPMPAVLSVSSEINTPSVPSMMDIMKAGKKPVNTLEINLDELKSSVEVLEELAPEEQERRQEIIEGDDDETIDTLVTFLKKEAL